MRYSNDGFLGLFALTIISIFILGSSTSSYTFRVGGKDGWVINPSEDYIHWPQRNRFHVNDSLYFKYKKGSDSVLVVNKDDYDSCNSNNPIQKMDEGDSLFTLDKPGPFFFISGNLENCQSGQKLIVVVLANTHEHSQPPSQPEAEAPIANRPSGPNSPVASPPKHSGSTSVRGLRVALVSLSVLVLRTWGGFALQQVGLV
ncbi:Early nodulin-like protein 2 [Glycine soja]|nr:Early nodulin-like protein 2 [Glycine soja]